jgi:hypothetical protein
MKHIIFMQIFRNYFYFFFFNIDLLFSILMHVWDRWNKIILMWFLFWIIFLLFIARSITATDVFIYFFIYDNDRKNK